MSKYLLAKVDFTLIVVLLILIYPSKKRWTMPTLPNLSLRGEISTVSFEFY